MQHGNFIDFPIFFSRLKTFSKQFDFGIFFHEDQEVQGVFLGYIYLGFKIRSRLLNNREKASTSTWSPSRKTQIDLRAQNNPKQFRYLHEFFSTSLLIRKF